MSEKMLVTQALDERDLPARPVEIRDSGFPDPPCDGGLVEHHRENRHEHA